VLGKILLGLLLVAGVAGCGSDARRNAADINRENHAREVVHMQRVLGDDPVSESVSLRVDGTAAVRRGGGRGYWDVAVQLSPADTERTLGLVRSAPFAALASNTITPGGFAGDDDGIRYMLRHDGQSVTVAGSQLPPSTRRLVDELNALIDGDRGRILADDRHFSASGVTGSGAGGDDAVTGLENSPATPVQGGARAPAADVSLSCYGSGGRQVGTPPPGLRAGPLRLSEMRRHGNVIEAPAVVQPGAAVTVAVSGRAGLLYGSAGRRPRHLSSAARIVRFEGCSDSTAGGGPARFDGGIVARGCTTLRVWIAGRDTPVRRRVGCRALRH
jgi:hypothetical protein